MYSCDYKADSSAAISPVFRNPNILIWHSTFVLLSMLKTFVVLIFVLIIWWVESLKEHNLFEIDSFNNVKVFTVTYVQYNVSLLNKSLFMSLKLNIGVCFCEFLIFIYLFPHIEGKYISWSTIREERWRQII